MVDSIDEQKRVKVESCLFILTHSKMRQTIHGVADAVLKAIEDNTGQEIWNADTSIPETGTELDTYTLVFDKKVSIGEFETRIGLSDKERFPLKFSVRHFRRPQDNVGVSSSDIGDRESPEGVAAAAAAATVEEGEEKEEVPDGAFVIDEPADNIAFDENGEPILVIQQTESGIFYTRFNVIISVAKATRALIPFEIRGYTEEEIRKKFDTFIENELPKY